MNFINFNKKYVIYNRNNIINLHQIISTKKAMIKMKKIVVFVLLASMVISCGPSKTVKESKKVIKGEWLLNTITFSEYGTFKVIFFNDVSKNCLEGSIWKFIPNNNSGKYTITNEDCSQGERNFIFTIKEVNSETVVLLNSIFKKATLLKLLVPIIFRTNFVTKTRVCLYIENFI